MRRLNIARMSLVIGLLIGMISWTESVGHIGNADFLVPAYPLGATHAWYHIFREVCGDVAMMPLYWQVVPVLMRKGIKGPGPNQITTTSNVFEWDKT